MGERNASSCQLADSLGFKLHFEVVSKERLLQASILSANGDVAMMERLMDEITDTERVQSLAKVIAHLENSRFGWNDIYLATTAPGENHAGTFAGSDGANFSFAMTKTEFSWDNVKDLKRPAESGEEISFTAS
jgi:hypothetical protein